MKFLGLLIMIMFLASCSMLNPVTRKELQLKMCVATIMHYEKALDDVEANAYHAHFSESCKEKTRSK